MSQELAPWDAQLAELAKQYAETEQDSSGGAFLSTRGGILRFDEEPLPGNQMAVVILDALRERTYYTTKFDATSETNLPPVCYALGRTEEDLAPHPTMQRGLDYFQPQSSECATCPHNEWGSSDTGRGKACSERRRLAVLPAGYYVPKKGSRDFDLHYYDSIEHYEDADIAFLKLNVMSVKDWARYVTQLASQLRRPPMGVITRVYLEPDPKSQFRVKFETVEELPSELYTTIMARHEEAKRMIETGYAPPQTGDAAPTRIRR